MAKYPDFLKKGDEIRIISPSGAVDTVFIEGAKSQLANWGYLPTEGMFTRKKYGRFAGTEQERYTDLQQALDDAKVKAILCSRGGYGLSQIIDKIDFKGFRKSPKWIIGFSDITILHQALYRATDYISLHSSMAKHLTELSDNTQSLIFLNNALQGKMPIYTLSPNQNNRKGSAKGKLIGGNLTTMINMRATPFDFDYEDAILFIEDVGEEPYKIDRMMQNLRLSGVLAKLSGLVVGQFTDTEEDEGMNATIYQIIANAVKEYDYPVCFNFSAGHIDENLPLPIGANASLNVDSKEVKLSFQTTFWKKARSIIVK